MTVPSDTIEGRNPVVEALKSGRPINKILIGSGVNPRGLSELYSLARARGIPVQQVDRNKLDALAHTRGHQGVIALAAAKEYVEVDDILAIARQRGEEPLLVLLDELEDPHNLGAILRTADAAGAHGVVITKRHSVPLTGAVAKASAGAVEYVPVARVANLVQTMEYLKKEGCWVVGAAMEAEDLYLHRDLTGSLALVIGSEGKGLGRLVKETCDYCVRLPMQGQINSLNAAVAASVMLYEVVRQRLQAR
ncbi:RNA methyltransferase [Clostridiales bacterium PH28_bin88]|nr:RNA methyltransferase [Clostridiales bacterium PH28_bin88]